MEYLISFFVTVSPLVGFAFMLLTAATLFRGPLHETLVMLACCTALILGLWFDQPVFFPAVAALILVVLTPIRIRRW